MISSWTMKSKSSTMQRNTLKMDGKCILLTTNQKYISHMNNLLITNRIKQRDLLYQKGGYHKRVIPSRMVTRFHNQDSQRTCIGFIPGVISNIM